MTCAGRIAFSISLGRDAFRREDRFGVELYRFHPAARVPRR
jgi:hypothetical protein